MVRVDWKNDENATYLKEQHPHDEAMHQQYDLNQQPVNSTAMTQDLNEYFTSISHKLDPVMDETVNFLTFKNRPSVVHQKNITHQQIHQQQPPQQLTLVHHHQSQESIDSMATLLSTSPKLPTTCVSRRVGPYSCNMCGKLYKYLCDIKRHIKSECINSPRKHACTICDKAYFRPNHLKTHLLSHDKIVKTMPSV